MAGQTIAIKLGNLVHVIDQALTYKLLINPQAMTTAGISLHDDDNTNYTVPSGKTFTLLWVLVSAHQTPQTIKVYQNDTADSSATLVDKFIHQAPDVNVPGLQLEWYEAGDLPTFAASKFINVLTSATSGSGQILAVIGYET